MRRPLTLLVVLATLVLLTACGDDGGEPGDDEGDGGTEVHTTPVEFGDGDEVWLRVETGGGFVPSIVNLRQVPSLLLFDDGRLVRLLETDEGVSEVVPAFESVELDEEQAAALLDSFAQVVDGPDPGEPQISDNPSTSIEVTTDGDTRDLSIYALHADEGLSDEEQGAREAAIDAIDSTFDLDGAEPFVPEEWMVLTSSIQTDVGAAATPVAWPLEPERTATIAEPKVCTRVAGDERDTVLDALEGANFDVLFSVDGELAEVALRPVLTGDETCNLSDNDEFVER